MAPPATVAGCRITGIGPSRTAGSACPETCDIELVSVIAPWVDLTPEAYCDLLGALGIACTTCPEVRDTCVEGVATGLFTEVDPAAAFETEPDCPTDTFRRIARAVGFIAGAAPASTPPPRRYRDEVRTRLRTGRGTSDATRSATTPGVERSGRQALWR